MYGRFECPNQEVKERSFGVVICGISYTWLMEPSSDVSGCPGDGALCSAHHPTADGISKELGLGAETYVAGL